MKDLTEKQEAVYNFISEVIKERGFPPTIREVGDQFSITAKGAYDHLKAIEKKGYIKTSKNQSRAIELLRHTPESTLPTRVMSIPLVGRVAAGQPLFAEENVEEYIPVPDEMTGKGATFALKVTGNSMQEAGINDGDIAIIKKTATADNGDTIVALVDDEEATLKVYYKEKDHVRLEPRNSEYKPIKAKNVIILGKLVGLYRFY